MKHLHKITTSFVIAFIIGLVITTPALAIPPLPSSFYGTVKVNNANVPDGTSIQALIGGQVYAEGFTQTYQGDSVFALDVRGDDSETAAQDGGREGDTIQFKIGGILAAQTGVWHAGTNVNLDLATSSSGSISTPHATPTPVPTQTAIVLIQPSSVSPAIVQASSTAAILVQPSQVDTQSAQPAQVATQSSEASSVPTLHVQLSLTPIASENNHDNGSGNISRFVAIIISLVVAVIIGYTLLTFRTKKI